MKLNYLSHLKTDLGLNLKGLRTQMHFVVLSLGVWLLMRLPRFVTGTGFGKRFFVQPLLTMRHQLYLYQHPKDLITSTTYSFWVNTPNRGIAQITDQNHPAIRAYKKAVEKGMKQEMFRKFTAFLAEECWDLNKYKDGKYDMKIFNFLYKELHD